MERSAKDYQEEESEGEGGGGKGEGELAPPGAVGTDGENPRQELALELGAGVDILVKHNLAFTDIVGGRLQLYAVRSLASVRWVRTLTLLPESLSALAVSDTEYPLR